jgi:hypothetical protein
MNGEGYGSDATRLISREVDDLLLHIRGLVLVRPVLASRGASEDELDAHERELQRLRKRLAALIRGGGGPTLHDDTLGALPS